VRRFTNWETGVRVPLIIRDPTLPQSHGQRSTALVELVDVMPTLADLAGVGAFVDDQAFGRARRGELTADAGW
jgi:arylsulfatase A-like enzyme